MLRYCPLLLLCFSIVHPWEVKSQRVELSSDRQSQIREQTSEDGGNVSPETVRVEKVIKSSMLPYIVQDASKSIPSSPSGSVSNVNTTIRLKFVQDNPNPARIGVISEASEKPTPYNFKNDMLNSNEHATRSHTEEMSSHKIIVYNQTKTQGQASKISSNNLLEQLNTLNWSDDDESDDLKHYTVQFGVKDVTPIEDKQIISESVVTDVHKDAIRSKHDRNEQKKVLDALQILLNNHDAPSITKNTREKGFNASKDQVELLQLLHKLIRNKDINYDFMNRLLTVFYMNGYKNKLLKVLFDIIIEHIQEHGNSEEQRELIHSIIVFWEVLRKVGNQGDILDDSKSITSDETLHEQLKVLKLLQLISRLKDSNVNNQHVLRAGYLKELRDLYDSSSNKDHLMKVIYDFWKNKQTSKQNTPEPIWKQNFPIHGEAAKEGDINRLLHYILQQREVSKNDKIVLIKDYKKTHSNTLPQKDKLEMMFDYIKNNKVTQKKPDSLLVIKDIYEEVENNKYDDSHLPIFLTSGSNKIRNNLKKKPILDTLVSEKESSKNMYKMLLKLLTSTEIRNKGDLKIKIIDLIKDLNPNVIDTSNESNSDEEDGDVSDDSWQKPKEEDENKSKGCVTGSTWISNCQSCVCVRGLPVCTQLVNCVKRQADVPMVCKPHSTFKLDNCNYCKCTSEGFPICTFKQCKEPATENPSGEIHWRNNHAVCPCQKKWPTCAPGTSWRSGCSDCICDKHGQTVCHRVDNCQLLP